MTISSELEARLLRLETSARRWKFAALLLMTLGIGAVSLGGGIIIGGGTGGMRAPLVTADKLVANKSITLNDSNGVARLVMSADNDNPAITFRDKNDHTLLTIAVEKDAANMLITDAAGKKLFSAP